ncbi:hypothetical protein SAMN02746041_01795 [Desulfacinum hydrothermale DSM 13146]|uniref:Uncharacterized protein n=1 Tax=Desulfacinum hydrothermale DSM 13146 TaxID=1121390 RepID=A0A1W1XI75_9BACT|nr:hypothetical protein [Desulfacinum hydrothermale]SMC23660.1 hypothetical protein SAMN02746041_01795 [Desulfacinum hydrothermale DSM 13146]
MRECLILTGFCLLLAAMIGAQIKLFPNRHPKTDLLIDLLNLLGGGR